LTEFAEVKLNKEPLSVGKMLGYGKNLNPMGFRWGSNSNSNLKPEYFARYSNGGGTLRVSHASTVEKLYAWEKKLYLEVKVRFQTLIFILCFPDFAFDLCLCLLPFFPHD
jgi:Protein of unknown function (DUF632)